MPSFARLVLESRKFNGLKAGVAALLTLSAAAAAAQAQTPAAPTPLTPPPGFVSTPASNVIAADLAWWSPTGNPAFVVEFVGQAAGQPALVIRFSRAVAEAATSSKYLRVLDDAGKPVAGEWTAGGVPTVLVRTGLTPGRYTVIVDPRIASQQGDALNVLLAGPMILR